MNTIPVKAKSTALTKGQSKKVFDAAKVSPETIKQDKANKTLKYYKHLSDHKRVLGSHNVQEGSESDLKRLINYSPERVLKAKSPVR